MLRLPRRGSPNHVGRQLTAVHRHPTRVRRRVASAVAAASRTRRRLSLSRPRRRRRVPPLVLRSRKPVVGRVVERSRDYVDGAGGEEGAGHEAANDLALGAGQRDSEGAVGESRGTGRRRLREESGGDGENVEAAVEGDGGAGGGGRLAEGDVGDGTRAGEDAEAHVLSPAEPGDGVDDVVSAGDFEDVWAHGGLSVAGDDDGGLGLVLGARGTAPWPPDDLDGGAVSLGGVWAGIGGGGLLGGGGVVTLLGGLAFGAGDYLERIGKRVKLYLLVVVVMVLKLREHIVASFILWF